MEMEMEMEMEPEGAMAKANGTQPPRREGEPPPRSPQQNSNIKLVARKHTEVELKHAASDTKGSSPDRSAPPLESEIGAHDSGLEVDDGAGGEDDDRDNSVSVYAMSTYPRVNPAHRVEYPYENGGMDGGATIDSARTLYAEEVEFVMENGRQYCGDYYMPIDEDEQTRQFIAHQVYLKLFGLELTTVPLEDPRYILDIGTGTGEWAVGMAEKYPDAEVFGTDIAPIQPTQQVPFNIEFHIENAEDEWIRPADTVDLVHIRDMSGAFSDWRSIYRQAFGCIRPGGFIEVLDLEDFYADKNLLSFYPPNSVAHILVPALYEAQELTGRPRGIAHLDPALLKEVGFTNVIESVYDLGIGGRENSSYGNLWLLAVVTGMEAAFLRPLSTTLGWDPSYVRELCARAAAETRALADDPARSQGFVVKLRVLTGQKPEVSADEAGSPEWTRAKVVAGPNGEVDAYSGGDDSTIGSRSGKTLRSEETV